MHAQKPNLNGRQRGIFQVVLKARMEFSEVVAKVYTHILPLGILTDIGSKKSISGIKSVVVHPSIQSSTILPDLHC